MMKQTVLQELITKLKEAEQYITDDDHELDRYYRSGLREAIDEAEALLEKEKEQMYEFAWEYERQCRINLNRSIEDCWDRFNNEDDVFKDTTRHIVGRAEGVEKIQALVEDKYIEKERDLLHQLIRYVWKLASQNEMLGGVEQSVLREWLEAPEKEPMTEEELKEMIPKWTEYVKSLTKDNEVNQ